MWFQIILNYQFRVLCSVFTSHRVSNTWFMWPNKVILHPGNLSATKIVGDHGCGLFVHVINNVPYECLAWHCNSQKQMWRWIENRQGTEIICIFNWAYWYANRVNISTCSLRSHKGNKYYLNLSVDSVSLNATKIFLIQPGLPNSDRFNIFQCQIYFATSKGQHATHFIINHTF